MITFNDTGDECGSVIISGCGRSGTTAMSRVCGALGFDWIADLPSCQEHAYLRQAVRDKDFSRIGEYVQDVPRQGLKLAMVGDDVLLRVAEFFPNCRIIFMIRDTLSVMESHVKNTDGEDGKELQLLSMFGSINSHEITNAKRVARHLPTCMVSYEKLMTQAMETTHGVAEFLKVPWRQSAVDEIRLRDERYSSVPMEA